MKTLALALLLAGCGGTTVEPCSENDVQLAALHAQCRERVATECDTADDCPALDECLAAERERCK